MKILIQIVILCGLMIGTAHAEKNATIDNHKAVVASTAEALDRDSVCTVCHSTNKSLLSIYQTSHGNKADSRTPSCQSCHGTSDSHLNGDAKQQVRPKPDVTFAEKSSVYPASSAPERNGQCLGCHEGGLRTHWTGSQHEGQGVACNSCHTVHTPKDKVLEKSSQPDVCFACHQSQRAETHLFSTHPIQAGKTACSDCHNSHGSTGPKLLIKNSTNETCYTCHADKRGPFLWEHSPVFDDCSNCHTPHGSNSEPLLKQRVPWLCQDCHTATHSAQVNSGSNLVDGYATPTVLNNPQTVTNLMPRSQANARACLNCHSMIHGSNHPAGGKFVR